MAGKTPAVFADVVLPAHATICSTFAMNQESSPRQPGRLSDKEKLIEELEGFTDMSVKTEALELCRRYLRRKRVSPEGFQEVMRVIGMFGSQKRWAPRLEAALGRQSARIRRALQGTMLTFYGGFGDWQNALRFASLRRDLTPHEIALAIEAFVVAGRIDKVHRLGKRVERWIDAIIYKGWGGDGAAYALRFLWYALGLYEAHGYDPKRRKRGRELAVESWNVVELHHAVGPEAGYNSIDMLLCLALENVNSRIAEVERMKTRLSDETSLSLPGNQEGLNAQMLARFNRCRRALERLVPEKRRKELGVDRPSSADQL